METFFLKRCPPYSKKAKKFAIRYTLINQLWFTCLSDCFILLPLVHTISLIKNHVGLTQSVNQEDVKKLWSKCSFFLSPPLPCSVWISMARCLNYNFEVNSQSHWVINLTAQGKDARPIASVSALWKSFLISPALPVLSEKMMEANLDTTFTGNWRGERSQG